MYKKYLIGSGAAFAVGLAGLASTAMAKVDGTITIGSSLTHW